MRRFVNNWILRKAIKHLSKEKVVYKSSLHNRFREDGVKTMGRFNIMLCLLLIIQTKTNKFLGIRNIELDENSEILRIKIQLNKPTHLIIYKEDVEHELGNVIQKRVQLELTYTNKLFGLDYYSVI